MRYEYAIDKNGDIVIIYKEDDYNTDTGLTEAELEILTK